MANLVGKNVRVRGGWWHYQFEYRGRVFSGNTGFEGLPAYRELAEAHATERRHRVLMPRVRVARWRTLFHGEEIPACSTCYVLGSRTRTYYVGQTVNLRDRIKAHGWKIGAGQVATEWGEVIGAVKYRTGLRYGEWLMLEAKLIRSLSPVFNKQLAPVVPARTARSFRFEAAAPVSTAELLNLPLYKAPLVSIRELAINLGLNEDVLRGRLGNLVVPAISRHTVMSLSASNPDILPFGIEDACSLSAGNSKRWSASC